MVQLFTDINLKWEDVESINVLKPKSGDRKIVINGITITRNMLNKRDTNIQIDGARMHVFGIDFVLKIDCPLQYRKFGLWNLKQSDIEYRVWQTIKPKDKKYFAEIIDYRKGEYICFKRYNEIHKDVSIRNKQITKKHRDKVEKLAIKYGLSDIMTDYWNGQSTPHNWSLIDNTPLIFDFGFFYDS